MGAMNDVDEDVRCPNCGRPLSEVTAAPCTKRAAPRLAESVCVPDLPCPKCGHDSVALAYCAGEGKGLFLPQDRCYFGEREHFHRRCMRCNYRWRTNDVIA